MPTALIAEDEPLLAAALAGELARAWPELRIVATVGDGASAVREALEHRPDVLFFDIRMPGLGGLDAAAELADRWDETRAGPLPALVFVTAYDQYAVQAFEAQALDYVLKPVQPARLLKTVQKLRSTLSGHPATATNRIAIDTDQADALAVRLHALLATLEPVGPAAQQPLRQLAASTAGSGGNTIRMVAVDDVLFLQATDKYVRVVTPGAEYLLRTPLKDLLAQLDGTVFWQIHRATVVRADAIDTAWRDEAGRLTLTLHGHAERLAVSRLYAHRFKAL